MHKLTKRIKYRINNNKKHQTLVTTFLQHNDALVFEFELNVTLLGQLGVEFMLDQAFVYIYIQFKKL